MPVERLYGIGKVTAKRLHDMGFKTCLDLQGLSRSDMIHEFGKWGDSLYDYCRGEDDREIETDFERKSLSTEETFSKDLSDIDELKSIISRLALEVQEALLDYDDRTVKNLHVKIKYFDFRQTTIERQIPLSEANALDLFEERWNQDPRPVRLLGVGVKFTSESSIPIVSHQLKMSV
jgi:DNA polymerase-4